MHKDEFSRATARPSRSTPTIYSFAKPLRSIVRATLAVALVSVPLPLIGILPLPLIGIPREQARQL